MNPILEKISPSNGAAIGSSVPLADFYGAFGIRPTDGVLFVGNGSDAQILTLDPMTGVATALPSTTGANLIADLDFATPEPGTMVTMALALAGLGLFARKRRRATS